MLAQIANIGDAAKLSSFHKLGFRNFIPGTTLKQQPTSSSIDWTATLDLLQR